MPESTTKNTESTKHWLVRHAETMPLGGVFDPAERVLDLMFIGAIQQTARGCGFRPTMADIRKLVAALEEAHQVIADRCEAATKKAA